MREYILLLGIIFLSSCQLLKKNDPYSHLEHYRLCNKTKEVKHITNPYGEIKNVRIASKRHFNGDTLKIELAAKSLIEGQEVEIATHRLSTGDCMDYYLELTSTEKLRMSSIKVLLIEVGYDGETHCLIRDHNAGDYVTDKGKVLSGLEACDW